MRLSYGWIIIAAGMAMSCVGMGSMMSLGVFLQPIAQETGWSRTAISMAALLNFLGMGVGSFVWGALSDRFGARVVVMAGGTMLGLGLGFASQTESVLAFQAVYGGTVGLAVGSLYVPMTALAVRWFDRNRSLAVALVSVGMGMGTTIMAPLAGWLVRQGDWRTAMLTMAGIAWAVILPAALLLREPPVPTGGVAALHADEPADISLAKALVSPQCLAISLAFFADLPHGELCRRLRNPRDGGGVSLRDGWAGRAGWADFLRNGLGPRGRSADIDRGADVAGDGDTAVAGGRGPGRILCGGAGVRVCLWRGDAALRDFGAGEFPWPDHGRGVWRGGDGVVLRDGDRAVAGRVRV